MRLAMIGLGKMGANMARRLCRQGLEVVGYNRSPAIVETLAEEEGLIPVGSLAELVGQLSTPRIIWLMLPSGDPTEATLKALIPLLAPGDIIIDGGNANYHDSVRRGRLLAESSLGFADAGTSGGVWGLENGYCLMLGAEAPTMQTIEPIVRALAPAPDRGWAHVGPIGAGHYTKMVHNGIEYGAMQAYAEGFALLRGKREFNLDLAQIAELWRHGSVVRSWLLDLSAEALARDQELADIEPLVADSGEGRWTAIEAVEQGLTLPVITLALQMRFASQDKEGYPHKILAMMRHAFGGHTVEKK